MKTHTRAVIDKCTAFKLRLNDERRLHNEIYSMFFQNPESNGERILYRKELLKDGDMVVNIFSDGEPELKPWFKSSTVKSYDIDFSKFKDLSFKLRANPCKKVSGKEIPLKTVEDVNKWIDRKATENGFRLKSVETVIKPAKVFSHKGTKCTLNSVEFEGVIEITDPDLFKKAFENGIGRGKAFGFGMIAVSKVSNNN